MNRIVNVHVCTTYKRMIIPLPECECGPMHWVRHPYWYRGRRTSNDKLGKFWRSVADVVQGLGPGGNDKWEETIAWTNLYPVSYACGGNPGTKLERAQFAGSAKLLALALRAWKPCAALFVTEIDRPEDLGDLEWSRPFHEKLGVTDISPTGEWPVLATSKVSAAGPDASALFVVRPDAPRVSRADDWARGVIKAARELGCFSK